MSVILDPENIFSFNEEWSKLEKEWGEPVDLETEDDSPAQLRQVFSSLDLLRTTFDSSFLTKKIRRKVGRQLSKTSDIEYKSFLADLERDAVKELPPKQFFYINGQIMSALSVDEICERIDDVFQSIDKLSAATSTLRLKKIPETVNCSISTGGLSFDDTVEMEVEKNDDGDIDVFIDEAFQQLGETIATLSETCDEDIKDSVTTLVKKFTSILKSPAVNKSPKRRQKCCDKFRELSEFWNSRAFCDN